MAEDWSADVRKYVPEADDAVIAGIVRYCGIALRNRDSSLVAFSDAKETARVRDNFLKKKLGLTQSNEVLDQSIAAVGERMKDDRTKNRVTAYYLLADSFGKLELFRKSPSAKATGLGSPKAPAAGAGANAASSGLASLDGGMISKPAAKKAVSAKAVKPAEFVSPPPVAVETPQASASASATPPPAPIAAAPAIVAASSPSAASAAANQSQPSAESSPTRPLADLPTTVVSGEASGMNWLPWLLLALAVLVLIWWLYVR